MAIAVVTGANRGIGLELVKQLKEKSYEVYAVCRETSKELSDLSPKKIIENIDVTDAKSLSQLKTEIKESKIDVLINNAGMMKPDKWPELDFEGISDQIKVNTLGPLRTTQALSDKLSEGSKVIMISSRMGSIKDNSSGGSYGYRLSKAALNAASKSLALDMKEHGVPVIIMHPGYVKTRMTSKNGDLTPEQSVQGILKTALSKDIEHTGTFWHTNGEELPW